VTMLLPQMIGISEKMYVGWMTDINDYFHVYL